jgi:serine protease Do
VMLVAATVAWALVTGEGRGRHAAFGGEVSAQRASAGKADWTGQSHQRSPAAVDAISHATVGGGVHVIAQPGQSSGATAFMQPAAAVAQGRHAFNTVSSLILPTVVHIHATQSQLVRRNIPAGAAAGARFADPFDGVPEKFVRNKAYENVGSGVIIDSRGFVLTNYHVISAATDLLVSVSGRINRDFPAKVVAVDAAGDLALIRILGAPALPEARLGNSTSTQVGDWALAFGSPFGLEQTVTQGIISNRRKSLTVDGVSYGEMLQTDAPINRGSSGGPLVDLNAEVVGINSAIYGPNAAFSGTGFAIPIHRAKVFLAQNSRVFNR